MSVTSWMSWEGGVDLMGGITTDSGTRPVIVHVARMVHTPRGSAPAGLISYEPDNGPAIVGFISTNRRVGEYFGPNVFDGSPFESQPVLPAQFDIEYDGFEATARIDLQNLRIELRLGGLGVIKEYTRAASAPPTNLPFAQYGLEAHANNVELYINGNRANVQPVIDPGNDFFGAVYSPSGIYYRNSQVRKVEDEGGTA